MLAIVTRAPRAARLAAFASFASLIASCSPMAVGGPVRSIPHTSPVAYVQAPDTPPAATHALAEQALPEHPHMAQNGASCMHADPLTTNTIAWSGPVGRDSEVVSRAMGFLGGECPTVNLDRRGRIVTVCVHGRTPSLVVLDPESLEVLDRHVLPARRVPRLNFRVGANDTSGGAYFYLDEHDRAVIGTANGTIEIVAVDESSGSPRLRLEERIDIAERLRLPSGEVDKITAVMPDWQGRLWFVARRGVLGYVDDARRVATLRLDGEEIENSFSVAEDGVYIVSDHALYRFEASEHGPSLVWRETYDRGTRRKVGQINRGSGTTPTILGDYVAIGDNAEPRMNVVVYRRARDVVDRRVCATPVFAPGRSATENTLIGYGRSLVVENNAGYDVFLTMRHGRTSAPGLARVDIREDESGCDVVWESGIVSQTTVPKLSIATGLVYAYSKLPNAPDGTDAYYFTGIDFTTGETAFRVLTGTGVRYDNHWAAITLAPDGTAFVGVLNGLIRIRDRVVAGGGR